MSEFKGTKGKWKFVRYENSFEVETNGIDNWLIAKTITNYKQDEANIKLISCAPEMLELLQVCAINLPMNEHGILISKIEQLIKKATSCQ